MLRSCGGHKQQRGNTVCAGSEASPWNLSGKSSQSVFIKANMEDRNDFKLKQIWVISHGLMRQGSGPVCLAGAAVWIVLFRGCVSLQVIQAMYNLA